MIKNEHTLTLIDGVFNKADTVEIILSLIDKKLKFNELNSFRNLIKSKEKDQDIQKRIDELRKARVLFLEYVQLHKNENFKIDSDIKIKTV